MRGEDSPLKCRFLEEEGPSERSTLQGREMARIEIDTQKCKGCGFCVNFCPRNLIQLDSHFNNKGYHPAVFKGQEKCTGCAICALMCPEVAITVYK